MWCGFMVICTVLCHVCLQFSEGQGLETTCGTIRFDKPTIAGRNISLHFEPVHNFANRSVDWKYLAGGSWISITNSWKYQADNFTLVVNTTSNERVLSFGVQYGDCVSNTGTVRLETLQDCGKFYERTKNVHLGGTVELGYFPTDSILQHPNIYVRIFRVINESCVNTYSCVITNKTGTFEFHEVDNFEYVLSIRNLSNMVDGSYFVQCTTGRQSSNKITMPVVVAAPVRPNDPVIQDTETIGNCTHCLIVTMGTNYTIKCNVSGGTGPIDVKIYVDGVEMDTSNGTDDNYIATATMTGDRHQKYVRCEVLNLALVTPVVAEARIYVTVEPSDPVITIQNTSAETLIGHVSCRSARARPPADLTFALIGENQVQIKQNVTKYTDGTFSTVASLGVIKRDWNGRSVNCCVSHVTLTNTKCAAYSLNVTFPPESIEITHTQQFAEILPSYTYQVHCVIAKAFPLCQAGIKMSHDIERRIDTTSNHTSGYIVTTVTEARLNVTKSDSGRSITCTAKCEDLDYKEHAVHIISVPYPPEITLNITSSELNITEGSSVVIKCSADSNPVPYFRWLDSKNSFLDTDSQCGHAASCLRIERVTIANSGRYRCVAQNNISDEISKYFSVNVQERRFEQDSNVGDSKNSNTTMWAILGAALTLLVLVTVIVVVIVKKKRATKAQSMSGEREKPTNINYHPEDDDRNVYQDGGEASGNEVSHPTAAIKNNDQVYQKELVYADLDLEDSVDMKAGILSIRRTSQTEYVEIDFKKKAPPLSDETESDSENIYVNN